MGGINIPSDSFLQKLRTQCTKFGAVLVLDEVQSGYGRSGKFFAHQHSNIKADMITIAKGMGNGFPIGGVLISPEFKAKHSLLGTTFGGNYLACAAGIAVLDVIKEEKLIENASDIGNYLMNSIREFDNVKEVRGLGLMIGVEFDFPIAGIRSKLLHEYKIFTGSSSNKNTLRILPGLNLKRKEADLFLEAFEAVLAAEEVKQ